MPAQGMPGDRRQVLLVVGTAEADPSAQAVAAALARRGVAVQWIETAHFPAGWRLTHEPGGHARGRCAGFAPGTAAAAWVRAVEPGAGLPPMAAAHRTACVAQSAAALWDWLDAIDAYVLDPPATLLALPAKPGQQRRAAQLGLDVPLSLVSNDAAAVRDFARRCPQGMVGKLIVSGTVGWADEGGGERAFPTFEVTADDLQRLDGLELAPLLFQERLRSRRELRLTVVGRRRFAAAMRPGDELDLRHDPVALATLHAVDDVPAAVEDRVMGLLDGLRLDCAAVDLVETVDGRWVFLEVNAPCQFDHVEQAGLPVADAVADLLTGAAPSRFDDRRALQAGAFRR